MKAAEFKRCRHTLGLTQSELARLLRLAENGARSIRHYESGKRKVPGPISVVLDMLCNDFEPLSALKMDQSLDDIERKLGEISDHFYRSRV